MLVKVDGKIIGEGEVKTPETLEILRKPHHLQTNTVQLVRFTEVHSKNTAKFRQISHSICVAFCQGLKIDVHYVVIDVPDIAFYPVYLTVKYFEKNKQKTKTKTMAKDVNLQTCKAGRET